MICCDSETHGILGVLPRKLKRVRRGFFPFGSRSLFRGELLNFWGVSFQLLLPIPKLHDLGDLHAKKKCELFIVGDYATQLYKDCKPL